MGSSMDAVTLVWYARTESGWKRFPVITGRNGRIKKGSVLVDGREHKFPDGHFELRYYENRKTKYRNAGTDATEAVNQCDRLQSLSDAKASAMSAGVTVNEPTTRKTIKAEASRFVKGAEDRGAKEAALVNASAMLEFQLANPKLTYVDEINPDAAMVFRQFLQKKGNGDRTVSNKHQRLTGFLKFCKVDYRAWDMPAPKFEKKLPNVYVQDEIDGMLKACKRNYNRVLIGVLKGAGLRDAELQHLCWTDVSFSESKLRVTSKPEYDWKIKDCEERDIPLTDDLLKELKQWREANPKAKLVLPTANGTPNEKFLRAIKYLAQRANVSNATLHRFRRTYCTNLLRGGMDIRTVMLLMGHSDVESTMRYLTPATDDSVRIKINAILQ